MSYKAVLRMSSTHDLSLVNQVKIEETLENIVYISSSYKFDSLTFTGKLSERSRRFSKL